VVKPQVPLISLFFPEKTAGGKTTAAESLTFSGGGEQITAKMSADIRCYFAVKECVVDT
jgi:hypothetical protein